MTVNYHFAVSLMKQECSACSCSTQVLNVTFTVAFFTYHIKEYCPKDLLLTLEWFHHIQQTPQKSKYFLNHSFHIKTTEVRLPRLMANEAQNYFYPLFIYGFAY